MSDSNPAAESLPSARYGRGHHTEGKEGAVVLENSGIEISHEHAPVSARPVEHDEAPVIWRKVIEQAFFDATYPTPAPTAKLRNGLRPTHEERNQARRWLTGFSLDFVLACDHAEMIPADVCRKAEDLKAKGWRCPVDDGRRKHMLRNRRNALNRD